MFIRIFSHGNSSGFRQNRKKGCTRTQIVKRYWQSSKKLIPTANKVQSHFLTFTLDVTITWAQKSRKIILKKALESVLDN